MEDRTMNKMWLVRHLEVTRQLVLEDLRVVKVEFFFVPMLYLSCNLEVNTTGVLWVSKFLDLFDVLFTYILSVLYSDLLELQATMTIAQRQQLAHATSKV